MIRIPLQPHTLPLGKAHPTRSAAALSRQLFPLNGGHHGLSLYVDPARPVSLTNYFNRMYTGTVAVGTPAKEFSLVFDTGSADMWLFSENASSKKMSFVHYYDENASSTSKVSNTAWSIQYGKGSASGRLVTDVVSLAGLTASQVTFAEATKWSDDFESEQMPLDGLLGLAFSSVSSANAETLVDVLLRQGKIKERVFSFYLTADAASGSQFILGQPDLSLTSGQELTYLDLASSQGMWLLSMQGIKFGDQTLSYCQGASCGVLVDTGTSFIGMPTPDFYDFVSRIQAVRPDCGLDSGSGLILCSSSSASGFPDLSFSLQGHYFTLTGDMYYDQVQQVVGMMPIDVGSGGGFWILGDTFLKHHYTVFDMDQRKIGIVGAKPGLPYTPPKNKNVFERWSWQVIVLIAVGVILLILLCSCCVRFIHSRSPDHPAPVAYAMPVVAGGQQPYVLHQPPAFSSQPHRMQPARPQSEFARDFYSQA